MSTIMALAAEVAGWCYDDFPPAVRETAGYCVLDLLGVALAARDTAVATTARRFAGSAFGQGPIPAWGTPERLSLLGAIFSNASAANALDMEDGSRAVVGHPGSLIIPAALGAAQQTQGSGRQLLAAVVAAYEVAMRCGAARQRYPGSRGLGWTHGYEAYGPATAAGRLFGLSGEALAQALAIAGFQGPHPPTGLVAGSGVMLKQACAGWSSVTGAGAAMMAGSGFTAATALFDDPRFFDPARLLANLGAGFQISQVYFKPYAACRWAHGPLDAVFDLRREEGLQPDEISGIEVHTFSLVELLMNAAPATPVGAQFSLPYLLAAAVVDGEMGPAQLSAERIRDPRLLHLASRVTLRVQPDFDRAFPTQTAATLVVHTSRGRLERTVLHPWGDPANPMTPEQLEAKFLRLASPSLGNRRARQVIDLVGCLADQPVEALVDLLAAT